MASGSSQLWVFCAASNSVHRNASPEAPSPTHSHPQARQRATARFETNYPFSTVRALREGRDHLRNERVGIGKPVAHFALVPELLAVSDHDEVPASPLDQFDFSAIELGLDGSGQTGRFGVVVSLYAVFDRHLHAVGRSGFETLALWAAPNANPSSGKRFGSGLALSLIHISEPTRPY